MGNCLKLVEKQTEGTLSIQHRGMSSEKEKGIDTDKLKGDEKEKGKEGEDKEKGKEPEEDKNGQGKEKDAMDIDYLPVNPEEFERIVRMLRRDVGDLVVRLDRIPGNKDLNLQAWLLFYRLLTFTPEDTQRRISFMATVTFLSSCLISSPFSLLSMRCDVSLLY